MTKISITPTESTKELVIRKGVAQEIKPPVPLVFTGTFQSVVNWWKLRTTEEGGSKREFVKTSHLSYSKEKLTIILKVNENDMYQDVVTGLIKVQKDFEELGINKDKQWTVDAFAKFIRLRSYIFADKSEHKMLLSRLNKFKAKITADIASDKDTRGNSSSSAVKTLDTELPESFQLLISPYIGYEKIQFTVELCVDVSGSGVVIWLMSNELVDMLTALQDNIFASTLSEFQGIPLMEF